MDAVSLSQMWVLIQQVFGPLAPIVGGALVVWAVLTRSKNTDEGKLPVTRAEADKIEARLHDIEASVNQIKGALGIK